MSGYTNSAAGMEGGGARAKATLQPGIKQYFDGISRKVLPRFPRCSVIFQDGKNSVHENLGTINVLAFRKNCASVEDQKVPDAVITSSNTGSGPCSAV